MYSLRCYFSNTSISINIGANTNTIRFFCPFSLRIRVGAHVVGSMSRGNLDGDIAGNSRPLESWSGYETWGQGCRAAVELR